jgi:hypothetical protein
MHFTCLQFVPEGLSIYKYTDGGAFHYLDHLNNDLKGEAYFGDSSILAATVLSVHCLLL